MPEDFVVEWRIFLDRIYATPDTSLPDTGKLNRLSRQPAKPIHGVIGPGSTEY
jgi:hypothetical protein